MSPCPPTAEAMGHPLGDVRTREEPMKRIPFFAVAIIFEAVACVWVLNAHLPGLTINPFPMPLWQQVATVAVLAAGLLPLVIAAVRREAPPHRLYRAVAECLGVALWVFLVAVHPREVPPPIYMRLWVTLALAYPAFALPTRAAATLRPAMFAWWLIVGSCVTCELVIGEAIRLRDWRIMIVESESYAIITEDARRFHVAPSARWRHYYSSDVNAYFGAEESVVYQANSRGLRERELPIAKPPGVFRIAAIGDSFTLGEGVHVEDAWPQALERVLSERFPDANIEVINAGVSAYDTRQELEHYRRNIRAYQPDMVILAMVWNDADAGEPANFSAAIAGTSATLAQYLPLADRLARAIAALSGRTGVRTSQDDWARSFDALASLRDESEADGAAFVAAIYPSVRHPQNHALLAVYDLQESFCTQAGIRLFNAWPAFQRDNAGAWHVHPADNHPNTAAHRRFAGELSKYVESTLRTLLSPTENGNIGDL